MRLCRPIPDTRENPRIASAMIATWTFDPAVTDSPAIFGCFDLSQIFANFPIVPPAANLQERTTLLQSR